MRLEKTLRQTRPEYCDVHTYIPSYLHFFLNTVIGAALAGASTSSMYWLAKEIKCF